MSSRTLFGVARFGRVKMSQPFFKSNILDSLSMPLGYYHTSSPVVLDPLCMEPPTLWYCILRSCAAVKPYYKYRHEGTKM